MDQKLYIFINPIKEQIEILADDWYDAQNQLLQIVDSIMDWELYIPDENEEEEKFLFI